MMFKPTRLFASVPSGLCAATFILAQSVSPETLTTKTIDSRRKIPMYRLRFLLSVVATLFVSLALCSLTQAAPRTFVSGLGSDARSEEHTSELQSRSDLVCRLLLE